MDAVHIIALTLGVAWASGINLYAAILVLGILGANGAIVLPAELDLLMHPFVIAAAAVMYIIEFFADKIPGVDSGWDAIQTFIRIPAGAVLAAQAVGDVSEPIVLGAALLGGTFAAGTHATKAGTRVLVNTSPEPVSNWIMSITEDVLVVLGLWAALNHPIVFLVLLALFVLFMIWFLPKIWSSVRRLLTFVIRPLRSASAPQESAGV